MKLGAKARGYAMAAVACAACVGTWTSLVRADGDVARAVNRYTERSLKACPRFVDRWEAATTKMPRGSSMTICAAPDTAD